MVGRPRKFLAAASALSASRFSYFRKGERTEEREAAPRRYEVDKVVMADSFRPQDIIRAVVLARGDARSAVGSLGRGAQSLIV